jgi:hypothetical protein
MKTQTTNLFSKVVKSTAEKLLNEDLKIIEWLVNNTGGTHAGGLCLVPRWSTQSS